MEWAHSYGLTHFWIGLNDIVSEGTFVWESGRELSADVSKHWKPGEPNGDHHQNHASGGEDCAEINAAGWKFNSILGPKFDPNVDPKCHLNSFQNEPENWQ